MTTVLLVEDQEDIALPLQRMLQRDGYDVSWVDTGGAALEAIAGGPDVVVLDLGLPDMDGLDVCRQARETGFAGGIMIVTARSDELDRVVGLDYGADDYLAKPFGVAEMQARVRALARRAARYATAGSEAAVEQGVASSAAPAPGAAAAPSGPAAPAPSPAPDAGLRVDRAARRVWVGAAEVALTTKEFDVLALLDTMRGAVVSREQLMADVWDENWFGSTKTLDVTVGRLRQKLDEADAPAAVVTVRGVGFRLEDAPAGSARA